MAKFEAAPKDFSRLGGQDPCWDGAGWNGRSLPGFWPGSGTSFMIGFLILGNEQILRVHGSLLSEPVYLLFSLFLLAMLSSHLMDGRRALLFGAAGLAAMAGMTRYVGSSLIASSCLSLLMISGASSKAGAK